LQELEKSRNNCNEEFFKTTQSAPVDEDPTNDPFYRTPEFLQELEKSRNNCNEELADKKKNGFQPSKLQSRILMTKTSQIGISSKSTKAD